MKKHTKIYIKHFGLEDGTLKLCEWCDKQVAVDINHIEPRGMGGSKTKDSIENLVGMCRECHLAFEAKKIGKEELKAKHLLNL